MEEDIKILENLKEYLQMLIDNGIHKIQYNELWHDEKTVDCINALENLIKGYRELEKQLDSSRKANELLNKTNNELRLEIRITYSKVVNDIISKFNLGDEYIPKSKIKEKIEEYKQITDKYDKQMENDEETDLSYEEVREYACRLQALQELMEE